MTSRPLNVLLVSEDRALLRRLGRFLDVSGYQVQALADLPQATRAMHTATWDFVILDGEGKLEETLDLVRRGMQSTASAERACAFLLTATEEPESLEKALDAGVDDFLTKPVVYGELLARLRAGARKLEFERRLREQTGGDPITHLPSRGMFEEQWKRTLSTGGKHAQPAACVLLDIDFFQQINDAYGRSVGDQLLAAVAGALGAPCREAAALASFGGGTFAFRLPGLTDLEAAAWADRLRLELAEREFLCGETALRITCSCGVAAVDGDSARTVEDVLRQAEEALFAAKDSGRNCVTRHAELEEHARAWADFAAPGKLWERTVARDIMTSCARTLGVADPAPQAAEWLRRARLDALPVVDARGKLAGLATDRRLLGASEAGGGSMKVGDVMLTDVPFYEEDTSFATLREFFQRDSRSHVVIVRDRRPVGTVTLDNLAALGGKLTTGSFLPSAPCSRASDYLVVSDLPAAEAASR